MADPPPRRKTPSGGIPQRMFDQDPEEPDYGKTDWKKLIITASGGLFVWGFRVVVLAIFFWFKAEFVTKDKYLEDQGKQIDQWTKLTSTLTHIDDNLNQLDKHDDDQEKRLRDLEHKK